MSGFATVTAGSVGYFKGGSGFPVHLQGRKSGDLPYFKVSDMNIPGNELFMRTANNYITEEQRKKMGAVRIPAGAIVFAKVGAAVFLERKRILVQDSCIDNNMSAFIVDPAKIDTRFAHYLLTDFKLSSLVATTALPSLNGSQLREIPIRLPRLTEQRQIAEALSSIDDLAMVLERQIAKKRAIKQGMMQELLTGRTRLPGFVGEWDRVRLRDAAKVDPESLSLAATPSAEVIDYISLEDVSRGSVFGSTAYRFSEAPSRARRRLRVGDVLFGTVRPNLQSHAHYLGGLRRPVASTGFAVIRSRVGATNSDFLAQWVLSNDVIAQIERIIAGSSYPAVSSGDVRNLELLLPSVEEQRAIGEVLRDADAEIAALERRLEATRAIKQVMMQELLTGRTRLKVLETAA